MQKAICEFGGCMAKEDGNNLNHMLNRAKELAGGAYVNENILGIVDDCATIRTDSDLLLATTDLNHPIGHDPFVAGRIAALHAISDVYAMGAKPNFAIAQLILGRDAPTEHGEQYMAGLYSACNEERVAIVGGHTILSGEPIIGLSVIGYPAKSNIVLNKKGCVEGDMIWISKPIGTAMVLQAYYNSLLSDTDYTEAIDVMLTSNKVALNLVGAEIHALTDVTGFGLLGHLTEMLTEEQGAEILVKNVPYLSGISKLPPLQVRTRFINNNISYLKKAKKLKGDLDSAHKLALFDPQTNGALMAVAPDSASEVLSESGFVCIGKITEGGQGNEIHLFG